MKQMSVFYSFFTFLPHGMYVIPWGLVIVGFVTPFL